MLLLPGYLFPWLFIICRTSLFSRIWHMINIKTPHVLVWAKFPVFAKNFLPSFFCHFFKIILIYIYMSYPFSFLYLIVNVFRFFLLILLLMFSFWMWHFYCTWSTWNYNFNIIGTEIYHLRSWCMDAMKLMYRHLSK